MRLAKAFPEIRLIIAGHDHDPLKEPIRVGDTTIVRAGSLNQYVGRVDLDFDFEENSPKIRTELIPIENAEPDPEVAKILSIYQEKAPRASCPKRRAAVESVFARPRSVRRSSRVLFTSTAASVAPAATSSVVVSIGCSAAAV